MKYFIWISQLAAWNVQGNSDLKQNKKERDAYVLLVPEGGEFIKESEHQPVLDTIGMIHFLSDTV